MKKHNLLAFILLGTALVSCNSDKKATENLFSFDSAQFKEQYQPQESLSLALKNPENKKIDSIIYYINDKKIGAVKGSDKMNFAFADQKLGYQNIKALVYFEGENTEVTSRVELVSDIQPKILNYTIVNTYPHDLNAYTQGLEFYNGILLEGTGQYNESSLRKTDYRTGKVSEKINLEGKYFGEGITVLNDKLYQLTWQENTAFVYDAKTFKKEKTFSYFKPKMQGWGLTNDGKNLLMSDGTEKIWFVNPADFKEVDYINVYTANSKIKAVNELEWIDGKIYANIYTMDAIAVINPKNGAIEAVLDLSDLKSKVTNHPELDVLNGIAYNPATKTIFVTGKNWDKMFEIKITE